jgi:hypothetical protein
MLWSFISVKWEIKIPCARSYPIPGATQLARTAEDGRQEASTAGEYAIVLYPEGREPWARRRIAAPKPRPREGISRG